MMLYMRALVLLYILLITWITAAAAYQHPPPLNFTEMKPNSGKFFVFSVVGSVSLGSYSVNMTVGIHPPKQYLLVIDTGSDLTWISCMGSPDSAPGNPYDVTKGSGKIVPCHDGACTALDKDHNCSSPDRNDRCNFKLDYSDGTLVTGFLVRDQFPFKFRGESDSPQLTFGCGINQNQREQLFQPKNDGVLGLDRGRAGILTQLSDMGVTDNIVGHCFSGKPGGGGYLYIGGVPLLGIAWKSIVTSDVHYSLGSADMMIDDNNVTTGKNMGLNTVIDSGSTYTYFNSIGYGALLDLIEKNLHKNLIRAPEDYLIPLPVCWRGPFKSVDDVTRYFPNLALSFAEGEKNLKFQMHPNSYLIISGERNACLGILNGTEAGLGDLNLIGDISMQDKLVIYDNKNGKVGWAEANCNVRIS